MHPNQTFRRTPEARSIAFVRDRAFGILALPSCDGAPLLSHVPFLLSEDGTFAELHLVRSNPICRALVRGAEPGAPARIAVSGPDGYVSPDWYGLGPDQVPTWNYVAVHLTGTLTPLPVQTLPDMLRRLSDHFEERLPKSPWRMDKLTPDTRDKLLRMILPFRFRVETVDSTWKLGQNKPDDARQSAAEALETGVGHELGALSALMQTPPVTEHDD